MAQLLFGTAGVPISATLPNTVAGVQRIRELGLDCMEVEFVQGVDMGVETAKLVGQAAIQHRVRLSVHAPYYINLNAREAQKVHASRQRILKSARIGAHFRAESIVVHAGFYLGDPPAKVYAVIKRHFEEMMQELRAEGSQVWLRPEVTGKSTQFGSLEEVLRLSQEVAGVAPCVDFSHWHARSGANNSYSEFVALLEEIEAALGRPGLDRMHIHLSGIAYSRAGERHHLILAESDLNYRELLVALRDKDVGGLLICESPNLEGDALLLQRTYTELMVTA